MLRSSSSWSFHHSYSTTNKPLSTNHFSWNNPTNQYHQKKRSIQSENFHRSSLVPLVNTPHQLGVARFERSKYTQTITTRVYSTQIDKNQQFRDDSIKDNNETKGTPNSSDLFSFTGYGRGLKVNLQEGDEVKTQSARTIAWSEGVKVWRTLDGNPFRAITRYLSGGPWVLEKVRAIQGNGFALISPFGWDVKIVPVQSDMHLNLIRGSFVAASASLDMFTKRQPLKFMPDIGLFTWGIRGNGQVAITSIGQIHEIKLRAKETMIMSRRHIVAWDSTVKQSQGPRATRIIDLLNPYIMFDSQKRQDAIMHFTAEPQSLVHLQGPGRVFMSAHYEPKLGFWKRLGRDRGKEVTAVEEQLSSHDKAKKKQEKQKT